MWTAPVGRERSSAPAKDRVGSGTVAQGSGLEIWQARSYEPLEAAEDGRHSALYFGQVSKGAKSWRVYH
jgi:hypothetical protein